jgi:CelD/BcsL family acetyltransferase involved in cellulose biosynthesis
MLLQHLEDEEVSLFLGEQLPGEDEWPQIEGMRFLRWEPSPVLTLDGSDWEALLASQSKSFRYDLSRKERRLAKGHHVSLRLAADPESFERDFALLMELHRARWPTGSSFNDAEAFHRDFGRLAFARGWSRLWLLEVDGHARAAWYGFRYAGQEAYYQAGRDPDWDRYSVGFLLLVHSIREAANDGMREYQFLRGGEPFKYRLATRDAGLDTVGYASGALAKATLETLARAPKPLLKRVARP